MFTFTIGELRSKPTLAQGQAANLKWDNGEYRVWLSRCSIEDGELDPVQVEQLIDGRWVDVTCDNPPIQVVGQALGVRSAVCVDGFWIRRAR